MENQNEGNLLNYLKCSGKAFKKCMEFRSKFYVTKRTKCAKTYQFKHDYEIVVKACHDTQMCSVSWKTLIIPVIQAVTHFISFYSAIILKR
jgi:hypothetical protein